MLNIVCVSIFQCTHNVEFYYITFFDKSCMSSKNSILTIQEISVKKVMKMAKLIANSDGPLNKEEIFTGLSLNYERKIFERAFKTCLDLKIIVETDDELFKIRSDMVSEIRNCHISDLSILFRTFLQDFAPFLLYVNLLSQGLMQLESAGFVKTLMKLGNSEKQIVAILNRWGSTSGALEKDKSDSFKIPQSDNILPRQYLDKLVRSLNNEIGVKNVLIDILDGKTFTYLSEQELNLNNITKALLEHEKTQENL